MDPRYAAFCRSWADRRQWIHFYPPNPSDADAVRGSCAEATAEMVRLFPELIRVRGHYGRTEHWWCKTATGEIVDPTAAQFGVSEGTPDPIGRRYVEHREGIDPEPLGKCLNCGSYVWFNAGYGGSACSAECAQELEWELGR